MTQAFPSGLTLLEQLRDRASQFDPLIAALKHYGVLPQLVREMLIEAAIAPIDISSDELLHACQQFYQQQQLKSEADVQAWLAQQGLDRNQLEPLITRNLRLDRYKRQTWGNKLEHHFLERKTKLDRVIYSLIRVRDVGTAQELYFRIQEGEARFDQLAREHSQGAEAETGGLIGPVELGVPHPVLAKLLLTSQPGQLLPPTRLGEWFIILQLEKFLPAQLDEAMQQRLLNELFETELKTAIAQTLSQLDTPEPANLPTLPDLTQPASVLPTS